MDHYENAIGPADLNESLHMMLFSVLFYAACFSVIKCYTRK